MEKNELNFFHNFARIRLRELHVHLIYKREKNVGHSEVKNNMPFSKDRVTLGYFRVRAGAVASPQLHLLCRSERLIDLRQEGQHTGPC